MYTEGRKTSHNYEREKEMRNFTNLYLYSECLLLSLQESHLEQSEGLFVMHEDMGR